jgi:hypothetical protein
MDRLLYTTPTSAIDTDYTQNSLGWSADFIIAIESVAYLADYRLQLRFSDGTTRVVDFGPFLRASRHPQTSAYLNKENFLRFRLEYGDLVWDHYDLCFPIADLYTGTI